MIREGDRVWLLSQSPSERTGIVYYISRHYGEEQSFYILLDDFTQRMQVTSLMVYKHEPIPLEELLTHQYADIRKLALSLPRDS